MDDLHQLLRGRDRAKLRDADGLLLDALEELACQLEVDVGLEQHATDLTKPILDVGFGQDSAPAQAGKGGLEFFAELIEHSPET